MLDKYLIEHCSPTLASLKTANLFSYAYRCEEELHAHLQAWNEHFKGKGVSLQVLRRRQNTALVYVFRKSRLQKDLQAPGVARFLAGYGYESTDADYALDRLKGRLSDGDGFPHEVGIFLSYPLGDVIGFIENAGKNCKCTGCWKVYCNECEAVRLFTQYQKCREVYRRLWKQGMSVLQLTVAV